MKPFVNLDEARLPDGTVFSLHKHDGKFYLKYNGLDLMSTALTFSEQMLAEKGCMHLLEGEPSRPKHPRILIGGLGMGFTLKRVLELVGRPATVEVAELVSEIIEWNRSHLVEHNGPLLEDERTSIHHGDLYDLLKNGKDSSYDAILIDIDDTPEMLITEVNGRLYTPGFLEKTKRALKPGGCAAYWLAMPTPKFEKALERAGFTVQSFAAKPHEKSKRTRHCIYLAHPKSRTR